MTLRGRRGDDGGGPDGAKASDTNPTTAFKGAVAACSSEVEGLVAAAIEGTMTVLDLDASDRGVLDPVFDRLLRRAVEVVGEMSASDIETNRSALKAQETIFKVKMQASRTAASVTMNNQAAELQANFTQQLTQKMHLVEV